MPPKTGTDAAQQPSNQHDLTTRPIPEVIRQIAVPAALGMLYTTLFNIVDIFFAGQLSTEAQAGLALGYQTYAVLMAFGYGLAAGMGALVGNAIGQGGAASARMICAQGLSYGAVTGCILAGLGAFAGPWIISLVSDPGGFRTAATGYFSVLLIALPGFVVTFGCNGILQAQGDGKSMQRAMLCAAIANVGLNPLCIYGIPGIWSGFGFEGLAVSSVISWAGVVVFMVWRALRSPALAQFGFHDLRPESAQYWEIATQAIPAASSFLVLFLSSFIVLYALKIFGEHAVAGYGVAIRIEQILFLPMLGLSHALLPVAAQNVGALSFDRVREAFAMCIRTGCILAVSSTLLLWSVGGWVIGFFTSDPEVTRVGVAYLRIDSLVLPFYMMMFAMNSMFQAMKRPVWPLWINIYRRVFGLAFFIWLFIGPLAFGEAGIWWAHVVALITGWIMSFVLLSRVADEKIGGLWGSRSLA